MTRNSTAACGGRLWHRIVMLLVLPLIQLGCADRGSPAAPPRILTLELVETLSPSQIDSLAASLFTATAPPSAKLPVDCWLVTFQSQYPDGGPATVTGQLFVPRYDDVAVRPLYVFASGSTGLTSMCRVSREHIAGIHWGLYRTHVLVHAGQGVMGMLPDYMGFADKGRLQPFFSAVAEGRMMLDAIRSAREFLSRNPQKGISGTAVFVAGFSQGGHAAFAAADLQSSYAPDARIAGVIGYGPTTDMKALFKEFPVDAPMVVYTYASLYGRERFDPDTILAARWAETLEDDVTRQCVGGMQAYYPWAPRDLYTRQFADALLAGALAQEFPEIDRILLENTTGLSGHRIPALILQGTDDIVVSVPAQKAFAERLCTEKSAVQLSIYQKARHDTRQAGFEEALSWMKAITQGGTPPSNCGEVQ